jgi:hypothetical protein
MAVLAAACSGNGTSPTNNAPTATSTSASTATPQGRTALLSNLEKSVDSRGQAADNWQAAIEGQVIPAGGGVKTGTESKVRIDISDGSIVRLSPESEFMLATLSPSETDPVTKFILDTGTLWVWVTKSLGGGSFEVETPVGVATVRGSLMSVGYDAGTNRLLLNCLEGECTLKDLAGRLTTLREGDETDSDGQTTAALRKMTRARLQEWLENFPEARAVIQRLLDRLREEPTPVSSGTAATTFGQTACDHPYLPIRAGSTWTYEMPGGQATWTIDEVTGDKEKANATMTYSANGTTLTWHWECTAQGVNSYDIAQLSSAQLGQFVDIKIAHPSGMWLPAAELLTVGYQWVHGYEMEMQMSLPDLPTGNVKAEGAFAQQFTVANAEAVTFGGQSYAGLQFDMQAETTTQIKTAQMTLPPITVKITGNNVFAKGIGMVSSTSTSEGNTSTTTLISFTIP